MSFLSLKLSSQNLDAHLTKMPFNSSIGQLDSSEFTFTKNDASSASTCLIDSFSENLVFQAQMSYKNQSNPCLSYYIRIGKGGQIYSLFNDFGGSAPPQWGHPNCIDSSHGEGDSFSPWADEVWQIIGVDGEQNNHHTRCISFAKR